MSSRTSKPPLSPAEIRRVRKSAEQIARGAGKILKSGFSHSMRVRFKGRINPVTEFDLKSEKYIVGQIKKKFPDHSILSEEGSSTEQRTGFRWIIDPLDGTVNYSHGYPIYSVSIALHYNESPVVGVVYDPERDEMFAAGKGAGAFLNNRKIAVTKERQLHKSMLATGFSYEVATMKPNNLGYFARAVKKCQAVRRGGSAALDLCYLAAGRFDGFWELDLAPWDTAAAILILEEAGGKISRLEGGKYSIFDPDILATNGRIHLSLRRVLLAK